MARDRTTVWHVTPESNIEDVEQNGIETYPCADTFVGSVEDGTVENIREGVYVCRKRRTMEQYAATCLEDVRAEMEDDERFALYKAEVNVSRLTTDPESDVAPNTPSAWIHADAIEDPELVEVGVLDD